MVYLPKLCTISAVSGSGSPVVPVPEVSPPLVGAPLLPGATVVAVVSLSALDEVDGSDEAGAFGLQARSVVRDRAARRMRLSLWL
jgi:hypothetical protein